MNHVQTRAGAVAVAIEGQGVPLVLLPSNGHDGHDFDAVVPTLARHFRTIAVDWPGTGRSEVPSPASSASAALCADALEDIVEALALPPAVFLGNSVGGMAAIRLAGRDAARVRGLVLVDTSGLVEPSFTKRVVCWLQGRELLRSAIGRRFPAFYMKARNEHVTAALERFDAWYAAPHGVAVDAAMWRSFGGPEGDVSVEAQAVRCPTLLVWGRRDPVLPMHLVGKRARRLLPHAEWAELDTGHVPFVEDPEAFLAVVLPFLRALSEDAQAPSALAGESRAP